MTNQIQDYIHETVEPIVSGSNTRVKRLEKIEAQIRRFSQVAENERLQAVEHSCKAMNEIIGKHSFYQVPEKLADLKRKIEELEGTSAI